MSIPSSNVMECESEEDACNTGTLQFVQWKLAFALVYEKNS